MTDIPTAGIGLQNELISLMSISLQHAEIYNNLLEECEEITQGFQHLYSD